VVVTSDSTTFIEVTGRSRPSRTGSGRRASRSSEPRTTGTARSRRSVSPRSRAFGDLVEQGVVDPVRVTRLSLQHAASVAALLLTTEAIVAEQLVAQPGAIVAPGFGDLAEGLARPSSPV
jgi:hypothetical protein